MRHRQNTTANKNISHVVAPVQFMRIAKLLGVTFSKHAMLFRKNDLLLKHTTDYLKNIVPLIFHAIYV